MRINNIPVKKLCALGLNVHVFDKNDLGVEPSIYRSSDLKY